MTRPDPQTPEALLSMVQDVREATEPHFVVAGASLIAALDGFGALEQAMARLLEPDDFDAIGRAADRIGRAAGERGAAAAGRALPPLRGVADRVGALQQRLAQVGQHLDTLKALAKADGMPVAMRAAAEGEVFDFPSDVKRVDALARKHLRPLQATLEELLGRTTAAADPGTHAGRRIGEEIDRACHALGARLAETRAHIGGLAAHGRALFEREGALQTALADTVASLQAGDRFRQRLEHVEAILQSAAPAGGGADLKAAFLVQASRQLEDAADTHLPQVDRAIDCLARVRAETQRFLADTAVAFPAMAACWPPMQAALARLHALAGGGSQAQASPSEEAADLSWHAREIAAAIGGVDRLCRLIAEISGNAVTACIVGHGAAHKDTVRRLRAVAEDMAAHAPAIGAEAHGLIAAVADICDTAAAGTGDVPALVEHEAGAIEARLLGLERRLSAARAAIDRAVGGLEQPIGEGLATLAAHREAVHRLDALLERAALPAGEWPAGIAREAEALERLRACLTMASEERVLDSWLAEIAVAPDGDFGGRRGALNHVVDSYEETRAPGRQADTNVYWL